MTRDGDTPLLEVRELAKAFSVRAGPATRRKVPLHAVRDVSFSLGRGETLGIVGESGCGKSTLARLLMGLERPTSGTVLVDGIPRLDRDRGPDSTYRKRIQMVFQNPQGSLDPRLTVGMSVGERLRLVDRLPRRVVAERVAKLLDDVGLDTQLAGRFPHQLSGGQKQRVAIARALSADPDILVCDEAVSALDASVQAQVLNLLTTLQADRGIACIFISHDLSVVAHVSQSVLVMYLGRVAEVGRVGEIFSDPQHPYTQTLLSAAPSSRDETRRRIVLHGELPAAGTSMTGCGFASRCWKSQEMCTEEEPGLTVRAGAQHRHACHFPEAFDDAWAGYRQLEASRAHDPEPGPSRTTDSPSAHLSPEVP